jgi:Arc/MetJ-type ribon-helix-helix transcriptional regulator
VKLSVSLPDDDVQFVDDYARNQGIASRSAVVHRALRLLRASELGPAYESAWREWEDAGEGAAWDEATADGLS